MAKKVLTYHYCEPLSAATAVQVDIDNGDGNLTVDSQTGDEPVLASGTLEYLEKQGIPVRGISTMGGKTCLVLTAGKGGQPWLRMPWSACNGATSWLLHLNPKIEFTLTAATAGGNVLLDLADTNVTHVRVVSGGGNIEVSLPESMATLSLVAKTGAGNVVVSIPAGAAARIQASSGLGKVMADPRFTPLEKTIFQSPDYERSNRRLEITLSSGAGNIIIKERQALAEPVLP